MTDAESAGRSRLGVLGMEVMGRNIALNAAGRGFDVAVYNRTTSKTVRFIEGEAADTSITGHHDLDDFVAALSAPRVVMLMVRAGAAVDAVLDALLPLLDAGDVVVDGGNSDFHDTERRVASLADQGIHFVGCGVSGGEVGAREGPSLMPGGAATAWKTIEPILTAVAAHAEDGAPCCAWLGDGGAGHFVKMVHNGIEYGEMQLLAEAYALMGRRGDENASMATTFAGWNDGPLASFLVEITAEILRTERDGAGVVDHIVDSAGQKGTGRWTAVTAFEAGEPATVIAEAVAARVVSARRGLRADASGLLTGPDEPIDAHELSDDLLRDALRAARIVSYAQGFGLLAAAHDEFGWDLDLATVASIWRAGCIIRSDLLDDIVEVCRGGDGATSLIVAEPFRTVLTETEPALRRTVGVALRAGVAVPTMSSALAFYDGLRTARGPANLIQAQRDYFGAHGYERVDRPAGDDFHTDWVGGGAETPMDAYDA